MQAMKGMHYAPGVTQQIVVAFRGGGRLLLDMEKKPLNHSAFTTVHGSSDYVSGCAMVYYRRTSSKMKPWLKEHKYTAYVTHGDVSQTALLLSVLIRRTQACLVVGFCCWFVASDENF